MCNFTPDKPQIPSPEVGLHVILGSRRGCCANSRQCGTAAAGAVTTTRILWGGCSGWSRCCRGSSEAVVIDRLHQLGQRTPEFLLQIHHSDEIEIVIDFLFWDKWYVVVTYGLVSIFFSIVLHCVFLLCFSNSRMKSLAIEAINCAQTSHSDFQSLIYERCLTSHLLLSLKGLSEC